jgi:hypothetical protein
LTFFPFPSGHNDIAAKWKRGGSFTKPPSNPCSRKGHQPHHTVKQQTFSSKKKNCLTVGLLEARAGTLTTELLGLASSVVGDEECAVVGDKSLLELVLGVLIDELLVVGDLGNAR